MNNLGQDIQNIGGKVGAFTRQLGSNFNQNVSDMGTSLGQLGQNAMSDIRQLAGTPQAMWSQAKQLQSQYGTPNQALLKNPLQYAKTMTAPIAGAAQHFATYTPLQELQTGAPLTQYPGRVGKQMWQHPVQTAIDAATVAAFAKMLAPNPAAQAAGAAMKADVTGPTIEPITQENFESEVLPRTREGYYGNGTPEEQYQVMLQKHPDLAIVRNTDGTVVRINDLASIKQEFGSDIMPQEYRNMVSKLAGQQGAANAATMLHPDEMAASMANQEGAAKLHGPITLNDVQKFEETGFDNAEEEAQTMQKMINGGDSWKMQGSYGRAMMDSIENGQTMLGEKPATDYYGNTIPSRDMVAAGTKGSPEYVANLQGEDYLRNVLGFKGKLDASVLKAGATGEEGFVNPNATVTRGEGTNTGAMERIVAGDPTARSNNVYAKELPDGRTAIYSYGDHFPMAILDKAGKTAIMNMDKYSMTTSAHQGVLRSVLDSAGVTTTPSTTDAMIGEISKIGGPNPANPDLSMKGGYAYGNEQAGFDEAIKSDQALQAAKAPAEPKFSTVSMMDESGEARTNVGDFKAKWVASDAWRGYYSVTPKAGSGWKSVASDWVTGDWSDAGEHASTSVQAKLDAMSVKVNGMGGEMTVVAAPTSNVFSTGYDIFVKGLTKAQIDSLNAEEGAVNLNAPVGAPNMSNAGPGTTQGQAMVGGKLPKTFDELLNLTEKSQTVGPKVSIAPKGK